MTERRIPVILGIDAEPDEHVFSPDDPSPWQGFELIFDYMRTVRRRLSDATGAPARFLWSLRLDPQIEEGYGSGTWPLDAYPTLIEEMMGHDDAIGVHPHAQRWDSQRGVWVFDHADQRWVNHCVTASFEAYGSHFGHPPDYHRFGSMFLSTETVLLVARLGARFDLTPEPGERPLEAGWRLGGEWTGSTPDYGSVPQFPYHPDPDDFRRPVAAAEDHLWIIPLSSSERPNPGTDARVRNLARVTASRLLHPSRTLRGVARRFRRRSVHRSSPSRPGWSTLRMWDSRWSPATFWQAAERLLARLDHPYLAFAVRSDIPVHPVEMERLRAILEHPLTRPLAKRLVFTTPQDALQRLGLDS